MDVIVMEQITIRLREDTIESLEGEAEEVGVSRSEHIRDIIASRGEVDELRSKVERLEREKQQLIADREQSTELVRYVEDELEYRQAPIWERAKWWVVGR